MRSIDMSRRHYRELLESQHIEGEHPADQAVAALAEVREVDEAVRRMSGEMSTSEARRQSTDSWTEYEDLRFQQRCIREERFFDAGYEMGRLAGIAEYGAVDQSPEAASLRRQVHRLLMPSHLSHIDRAMILLEVARAFLRPADHGANEPKTE